MTTIARFTGAIIDPESTEYSAASVSHAVHSSTPAVVVRPRTTADVAAALGFARAEGLPVVVRGGGHTAYSSIDGALVIDLAELSDVDVLEDGTVRIGGGAQWGPVAEVLAEHGRAITSGDASTVGVGGLTLGGGIGWLVRQTGLTLDSLVEAEVVLASGRVVTASDASEQDLFWALRGGGGNFGVVTSFTFRTYPLATVVAGSIDLDPDDLERALLAWRDVMRGAPEALNSTFTAKPALGPGVPPSIVVTLCYGGSDREAADLAIRPLLELPGIIGSDIGEKPYTDMLTAEHLPEDLTIVDNNGFARELTDDVATAVVRLNRAAADSVLMVRWIAGALNRVSAEATAFAHRDAQVLIVTAVVFPPGRPLEGVDLVHRRWTSVGDKLLGMYGNFTMDARADAARSIFPTKRLARLRSVKREYDPANVFAFNHNIVPAESTPVDTTRTVPTGEQ